MDTPWLFPVPARPSRFTAGDPRFCHLNVEVGPVSPYGFDPVETSLLHYDYQTLLDHNAPGRLGAGRAGIHAGYYLKGIGRTPAAANWNDSGDRYHATGHLSPSSALRERLITLVLLQEGLGDSIVPCEEIRFGSLTPDEQDFVATGASSSRPERPADLHLMALSAKPANFNRFSNIVWALNHHSSSPAGLGRLFLALERAFASPGDTTPMEGEPSDIARRMDQSFHRGLQNFAAYARIGLS